MADPQAFRIEGLKDFSRALNSVDSDYPKVLAEANRELAEDVVRRARIRAASRPGVARRAAKSLRAYSTSRSAIIRGGGRRYPYFWGAEFGSRRYAQFEDWRGNRWEGWDGGPGYFLHPTIREDANELLNDYFDRVQKLHKRAFPS